MNKNLKRLWQYLDEHRGTTPAQESLVEGLATAHDIEVTTELLQEVSKSFGSHFATSYLSPHNVAAFIAEIAATRNPSAVLDPTCGLGLLLKLVADHVDPTVVNGVEIDASIARVAARLIGESGSIFVGDVLRTKLPLQESYDLIVAEPPFGKQVRSPLVIESIGTPVQGAFSDVLAAWISSKLSESGMAILILPPSFLWSRRSAEAKKAIADLGCAITACIQLPSGSLQGTGIEAYVVIIERGTQDEVFVGQYTTDRAHQRVLIKNLVSRNEGRRPAQGRLCLWSDFRGYTSIEAQDRIQRLVPRLGFAPVPMKTLVLETTRTNRTAFKQLEVKSNSVYLPLVGRGKATASQESLPGRLKDYVQLQLDPELANARFVVNLLNRELGQAILNTVRTGTTIDRVRPSDLLEAMFYLPPLKIQNKVVSSLDRIVSIRGEIDELEAALWTDTRSIDQLAQQVESVNREDRFEDWIETLPFPLATILWRYHAASGSAREKYEALLHFFEALAEFMATVHLSAFLSDTEIWSQHRKGLQAALKRQNLSLERGTFGAWKCVSEYFGARLRQMIGKSLDVCAALYRTHNPQTLQMLASSKLLEVLQRANSVRNNWVGARGGCRREAGQDST